MSRLRRVASIQELRREESLTALADARAGQAEAHARVQTAHAEEQTMKRDLTNMMAGNAFDCGAYTALLGIHRGQMLHVGELDERLGEAEAEADAARSDYQRIDTEAGLLCREIKRLNKKLQRKREERSEAVQLDLHNTRRRSRRA